jgi:hypothetical protein
MEPAHGGKKRGNQAAIAEQEEDRNLPNSPQNAAAPSRRYREIGTLAPAPKPPAHI